jgi:hypothetical protein
MKQKLQALLLFAGVSITFGFLALVAPSPAPMFAQQPADQAVTRPDHMVTVGDVGSCNEGETEYNLLTHVGKRCTSANTWAPIVAVPGVTANQLYGVNASGIPTSLLAGDLNLASNATTGISAQRICHITYSFAVDGGTTPIIPAGNCTIPALAVITNVSINSTTAVTAVGAATVAVGCTGGTGCGASALMAATAKASLGTNVFGQSIPVPQTASTWVKTTAAGGVSLVIATGPLTAGIIELYIFYILSAS